MQFEWNGIVPSPGRRSWRYSKERLDELNRAVRIAYKSKGGIPLLKTYIDVNAKFELYSIWNDIFPLNVHSSERLGFSYQKTLKLIERLLSMGSKPGDLFLDPFCGSVTTLVAAQKIGRRWLGCDLSAEAYTLSTKRLEEVLNLHSGSDFHSGDQHFLEKNFLLFMIFII